MNIGTGDRGLKIVVRNLIGGVKVTLKRPCKRGLIFE